MRPPRFRPAALLSFLLTLPAQAQQATPFRAELLPSYHSLSNGYGHWSGVDLRVWYRSTRFTPVLSISTQSREEGSQRNVALGSYITFTERFYAVAGVSAAPFGDVTLFPRLRIDATGFWKVNPTGLVMSAGITALDFGASDAQIALLGAIRYAGPLILSGAARLNRDGAGGALSASGQIGGQYGAEHKSWIGGGLGAGREAYQLIAATPLDVRFTSVSGFVFFQRWLTPTTGPTVRYDFERKLDAYTRHGVTLGYFIEF